jgi:HK97 family phage major capsid protein
MAVEEIKSLIEDQGKAFEEFKSANDARLAEIEKKGASDVLVEEKLKRIDDALNTLAETKEAVDRKLPSRLDAMEAKMNRAMLGGDLKGDEKAVAELRVFNAEVKSRAASRGEHSPMDFDAKGYQDYRNAFLTYLRKGERALDNAEQKALAATVDPDGGYLVPADMSGRIVARAYETSPMREYASVQVISSDALEGLYDLNTGVSGGWVSEKAARTETNTPQLGKWRIDVHEQYANPAATQRILDDSVINVEAWLAAKTGDIIGRTENAAFVTGDGVGKPRGFASYTTAATADASRAWGQFEHVNTGANGAFLTTAVGPDVLLDVIGAFKAVYINANTAWYGNRAAITAVRKLKDQQGMYLWQPGMQAGQPQTLLTFPVRMMQDMATLATGSLSLALGDMGQAYQIVQRAGITTLRDPFTNKPYVHFYSTARVGGAAVDFEALKFVRFSA